MGRRLSSPVMIGRTSEMALLDALLAESASGARFVAISGETGIGKTRLLSTLITIAATRGVPAFVGGCPVAVMATPIPFAAITQALRSMVRSMDARGLDRTLGSARLELARLLPELGGPDDGVPPARPRDIGRLFEAVLLLVEQVAAPSGALLVLEDLHWADPSTWALVAHLFRNLGSTPVLVAVSYREDEPTAGAARTAMGELARDAAVERIELERLTLDDSNALLRALLEVGLSEPDIATIARRSEGIPFYLEELADQAVAASAVLPTSVRVAVEARTSRLTSRCRSVVDLVATSDGPVDVRLLGSASGFPQADLADTLQDAMDLHLLVPAGTRGQLVDTRHALIREALVAALVPGQAARLHAALADAIEARLEWAGTSDVERWRRLANHLIAAGERQRAVPALLRVAQAARMALAFEDADDAYGEVLGIVGDDLAPLATDAWRDVLADAAAVARLAGAPDRAIALQERALGLMDADAASDLALARIRLARYRAEAGQPQAAASLLRDVATTAPPGLRGRCALELAHVLLATHDHAGALEQAELALQSAREVGDDREERRAAAALGVALSMTGRHAEALVALAASRSPEDVGGGRATDQSRPSRLPDSLLRHVDRATILALAGDPEGASRIALDGSVTARLSGVSASWAAVLAALAGRELVRVGRWDDARAALGAISDGDHGSAAPKLVVLALLRVRQGDLHAAESAMTDVRVADIAATPGAGWVVLHAMAAAELALARGAIDAARAAVTNGLAGSEGDPDTLLRAELACLGLRIEADDASQARARRDAAAVAVAVVSGLALHATARSELAGASAPGLDPWVAAMGGGLDAELCRLRGERGPDAWRAAVRLSDGTPDPYAQAYRRFRLAESMLDEGEDRTSVTRVLHDCVDLARRLGAARLVEDARRIAVRARISIDLAAMVREPSGSTTPRQSARAIGLSEREVDVLELLAVGMTDRDIGARLFITEKTAGHHVSHILTKLTVTRRGEAAAVAHRIGVVGPGA